MAVTAGSSMVSSANFDLQAYFGISRTAAILPLTLYVVGLGAGPVIAAPLSEQLVCHLSMLRSQLTSVS